VAVSDPHASTPTQPLSEAVKDAEVVIVATNHSEFEGSDVLQEIVAVADGDCLLVDPWNAFGTAQVFAYASEVVALQEAATLDPRP